MRIAVVALTESGLDLGRAIRTAGLGEVAIFGPSCVVGDCSARGEGTGGVLFAAEEPGVSGWTGPLRLALPEIWAGHDAIVAIMALGIVARLVGPLASDKRSDPAVVAVDESARFAIGVLGGHGGGANALARSVAATLGAIPVITTASDALGLPAVDEIGREFGWKIERAENLTRVAAAVVRGGRIAVFQDADDRAWWSRFGPWPETFERIVDVEDLRRIEFEAILRISDRIDPPSLPGDRLVVYRPPTLVAGIGCKRGISAEVIGAFASRIFRDQGLALGSLARVATVSLKADEPGLIAFAASRSVPLVDFSTADLDGQAGVERPSAMVRSKIGIASVAEAAALRAARSTGLVVPKQKGPGVTVAIARISPDHQT